MPELPEVEHFRQLLIPLLRNHAIQIECVGENHRILLIEEDRSWIQGKLCTQVLRKGKQLVLVLVDTDEDCHPTETTTTKYLFLHMGMTGRIRVPGKQENWGGKKMNGQNDDDNNDDDDNSNNVKQIQAAVMIKASETTTLGSSWPPNYTYLIFRRSASKEETHGSDDDIQNEACFCDPRKFGSCFLQTDLSAFEALAPDALDTLNPLLVEKEIIPKLAHQRLCIKAILLDQKRAVSGVGNWIADEVLYQCAIHPDQCYLSYEQATQIWSALQRVVQTAVTALYNDTHYPEDWLFGYRWTKKKASVDAQGRTISFLTSGGRTSAIVASIQILYKSQKPKQMKPAQSKNMNKASRNKMEDQKDESKTITSSTINATATPGNTRKRKSPDTPLPLSASQDVEKTVPKTSSLTHRKKRIIAKKVSNDDIASSTSPVRRRSPRFVSP
jgi:formamidopyrimidine-DNA glycosylase